MNRGPFTQIALGVLMMLAAIALAFMMVMRVIEPTLGLSFAAFALTVTGLLLGVVGVIQHVQIRRDGEE